MRAKNRSHRCDINGPTMAHKMSETNSSFHVK